MPSKMSVIRWLNDRNKAEFQEMYRLARQVQAELRIDEIIEIADDTTNDWKPVYNKDGEIIDHKPDNEAIQRSRVKIDTRKWLAAKMLPKVYGDIQQHEMGVTGELAELLRDVSNRNSGLPPPIEHE